MPTVIVRIATYNSQTRGSRLLGPCYVVNSHFGTFHPGLLIFEADLDVRPLRVRLVLALEVVNRHSNRPV
jgi:hypothetical protein